MSSAPTPIPIRLRDEARTATWNPAVTRAAHVQVHVRCGDGTVEVRQSVNSGRVRVRADERIEVVTAAEA